MTLDAVTLQNHTKTGKFVLLSKKNSKVVIKTAKLIYVTPPHYEFN